MALMGLLRDLQPLHGWTLHLWHGDHGWRAESAAQAEALAAWARRQQLPLELDRAAAAPVGEAAARHWRYRCLEGLARQLGCRHVVTGHTASDRAETVLLNLARGSHRRGLGSLRSLRPLGSDPAADGPTSAGESIWLVRPLLLFCRADTARICREQGLPVWLDGSNDDLAFSRNRLRAEVLPVLEALHPGASRRISAQAERLAEELDQAEEVLDLALDALEAAGDGGPMALTRHRLGQLAPANQRLLLQHWLQHRLGRSLGAGQLDGLLARLAPGQGPGRHDLPGGWHLRWDTRTLSLMSPENCRG